MEKLSPARPALILCEMASSGGTPQATELLSKLWRRVSGRVPREGVVGVAPWPCFSQDAHEMAVVERGQGFHHLLYEQAGQSSLECTPPL